MFALRAQNSCLGTAGAPRVCGLELPSDAPLLAADEDQKEREGEGEKDVASVRHAQACVLPIELDRRYGAVGLRELDLLAQPVALHADVAALDERAYLQAEVAGEGALLVDPYQPQEIADALLRLERDEAFRRQQVTYGLERVKQFSWEETAKQYLQIYKRLYE